MYYRFGRLLSSWRFEKVSRSFLFATSVVVAVTSVPSFVTSSVLFADSSITPLVASGLPMIVSELPVDIRKCEVTVYQFESCPFCRKARAVLDYCKIPYTIVEVNPLTKSETKSFAADYKKVPILLVTDPASKQQYQIRDSKMIVKAVLSSAGMTNTGSLRTPLPKDAKLNEETVLNASTWEACGSTDEAWIKWIEAYLLQLVVVNIYGTLAESRETFDYLLTHKDFGWVAREASYWAGSLVMNLVAKSRLKKFGAIPKGEQRAAFFDACQVLGNAANGEFLGGATPSAADINAYGVIRSLEGTRTLKEAIEGGAGDEFKLWYANMNTVVGPSQAKAKASNATTRGKSA